MTSATVPARLYHIDWLRVVARPVLWSANEGVLPFYILHQPVQLGIGYLVIQWMISDALKWVVITMASLIIILLVRALLIRPNSILRFLFGMKRKHTG